jgi:lysophospholipase L1-like esterase
MSDRRRVPTGEAGDAAFPLDSAATGKTFTATILPRPSGNPMRHPSCVLRLPTLPGLLLALLTAVAAGEPAPFGDNVQLRDPLLNASSRFTTTRMGRVAFLGGSITEMEGYRPLVCAILRRRFPDTAFTVVNAGIASTCSTTGAFRLARDVLDQGPLDLLFVEFAVNDDQDGHHSRAECVRGLEGIIRHARAANPQLDIVVTYFVNPAMLAAIQAGRTPLTIEAHGAVAAHYGISTIDLAKEVAEEISAGTLTWERFGGVHPAPFGNAICARMIDELFTRAWRQPGATAPGAHADVAPLDPLSYAAGRFIALEQAQTTGAWILAVPDWKQLPGGKRERFTAIPMLSTTTVGASATLAFEGTAVGAYVVAGPDAGIAEASIDGGPFARVDLYHEYSKGLHYPRTVLFGSELKPGRHTLVVRMAEETRSGGHALRIMHFVAN